MPQYDLTLGEVADAKLTLLAHEMDTDRGGVIRKAIVLLEVVMQAQREGHALAVVHGDQVLMEITGIGSDRKDPR